MKKIQFFLAGDICRERCLLQTACQLELRLKFLDERSIHFQFNPGDLQLQIIDRRASLQLYERIDQGMKPLVGTHAGEVADGGPSL